MPKIVNGDLYIHRQYIHTLSPELVARVDLALNHLPTNCDWNLVKVDFDGIHITFINYPDFEVIAHPMLEQWNRVDGESGEVIYGNGSTINPTILHRKETFIDQFDDHYDMFAQLTRKEIGAGLYARENLSRIGHKMFWEQLLYEKGLKIVDHSLFSTDKEFEIVSGRGKEK